MLWFNGSIRNAVDQVKSSGVVLLVFVQGNDSLSEKYETCLKEKVLFNWDEYVAIKIPHDSLALQQFKQIYVSVPVPSIFLIQNNGIPLKVISSSDTSEIHSAISDVINKQKIKQEKKQKNSFKNESSSSRNIKNKEDTSTDLCHVKNIGCNFFDISEDELKTRMKEIRAFPTFLGIDSYEIPSTSSPSPKSHSARIQFRLPNNSMPSWEFPELSTLGDVRAYLMEKMKLSPNFKFLRTYPRHAFTHEDESKTLAALSLTPNAILIVVPYEDKTVQAKMTALLVQQNFLSTVINMLLKPLFGLFGYFKKQFVRSQPKNKAPERFSKVRSFQRTLKWYLLLRAARETSLAPDTGQVHDKRVNKKKLSPGSNIHGFKFDEDTDTDTEHPDNGNSTQQRFQ